MSRGKDFYQWTELDQTNFPEFWQQLFDYEADAPKLEPRDYPGLPCWNLTKQKVRKSKSLTDVLSKRRSFQNFGTQTPSERTLSQILEYSHGVQTPLSQGPVPSAGNLQALELYLVFFESSWIDAGVYHYQRKKHHLSQIATPTTREYWEEFVPPLLQVPGGALLWILVGDGARVEQKYGERGLRFLFLEAGHLMQNLCLMSVNCSFSTLPLGGFFEQKVAQELFLPPQDLVLYVGLCGQPRAS